MDYQKGTPRTQTRVTSWETEVDQDSFVRVIDFFVDLLPFDKLEFTHSKLGKEGNQPFHPKDLFKLFLYGYRYRLRSSNQLAKACRINIEVKWLLNDLQPSPRTINYFRANNAGPIEEAHRYFIRMLKEMNLIGGKALALDGMKVRGQNSTKNNFNKKKIDRHVKYIEGKMSDYLNQIDEVEKKQKPNIEDRAKRENAKIKIDSYQESLKKYEEIAQQVQGSDDGQVSTIDAEAKALNMHHNSVGVGYNIQATVDMDHQFIVDIRAGGINDQYELSPMSRRAQEITGEKEIHLVADAGYHNGVEIAAIEEMNIHSYVAPGREGIQTEKGYAKSDFTYDSVTDSYQCPAGHILETNGQNHLKKNSKSQHFVKRYTTRSCSNCVARKMCTDNVKGRVIERPIHQNAVDNNNARVKRYRSYYQLRQQTVEPVFGTWRRYWDMGYTLLKSKAKVETEFRLAAISYNLMRLVSILGIEEVKKRFQEVILFILNLWLLRLDYINEKASSKKWKYQKYITTFESY